MEKIPNYFVIEGELWEFTDEQLNEWKKDWQIESLDDMDPQDGDNYDELLLMITFGAKLLGPVATFDFVNKNVPIMNQIDIDMQHKNYLKTLKKNGKN